MTQVIDLGEVSAYALAVKYGYQGTEEEWVRAQQRFHDESARSASVSAYMASSASVSAYESRKSEDMSRSYAVGTEGQVREGDATDNSKYYSLQSQNSATSSAEYYKKVKQEASSALNAISGAIDNINQGLPQFTINLEDGKLYHSPSRFTFVVNKTTGNLDWGLTI